MLPKYFRVVLALTTLSACAGPSLADSISLPMRKSGYWEIVLKQKTGDWAKESTYHACIDGENDTSQMYEIDAASKGVCDALNIEGPEDNLSWDGECELGGMKSATKNNMKFSSPEAYVITAKGNFSVDGKAKEYTKSETAKWLDAKCPVGLKAGYREEGGVIVDELGKLVK
jgi:Protein of unknown function (DUF3617)